MCGVTGVLDPSSPRGERRVAGLNRLQAHRGPDDAVVHRVGPFVLGNTRLAIQDPGPEGNQPFTSADGRYVVVFNGEIYNFLELIDEHRLQPAGRCDGAIIPELWSRLGPACLRRFRGMYGLAVVDRDASTLTLARDPLGIKPLYWRATEKGRLAFASESRALAALDPRPRIDPEAMACFLHLGAVAGAMSPFEGVEAVRPNEYVTFDAAGRFVRQPVIVGGGPVPQWPSSDADPGPGLGARFTESVDLHLRSDVPTALLLSGGVDSTAVALAAGRLGHSLQCLTVAGLPGTHDESRQAADSAARYGHTHQVVRADLDTATVDAFFSAMPRPTIDGLNTLVVSRAVRAEGYKVALSGLGADEALGGYRHFRLLARMGVLAGLQRLPDRLTRLAISAGRTVRPGPRWRKIDRLVGDSAPRTPWELDLLVREVLPPDDVRRMTGIDPRALAVTTPPAGAADQPRFQAMVAAELALYLQSVLLPDADGFSMASSVELRVPFLDLPFFTQAVAATAGRKNYVGKTLLTHSMGDPHLDAVAAMPKRGFALPMARWMSDDGPLAGVVERLRDPSAPVWDHVDRSAAAPTVDAATVDGRWAGLWSLAALDGWLRSLPGRP